MRFRTFLASLVLSTTSSVALAGPLVELGYADSADLSGLEMGLGYAASSNGFHVAAIAGTVLHEGEADDGDDRYYFDASVDRCRDRTNGRFAKTSLCNGDWWGDFAAYGKIEAGFSYESFEAGIGYRFTELSSEPYGVVAFRGKEPVSIKASIGEDYVGIGLVLGR